MNCIPKNESGEAPRDEIADDDLPNAEKSPGGVWQRDIEKHDYYYDDSHGYEIYKPEDDEETDEH